MADILPAGTPAPDFTLPVTPDQKLSLSELISGSQSLMKLLATETPPLNDTELPARSLDIANTYGSSPARRRQTHRQTLTVWPNL